MLGQDHCPVCPACGTKDTRWLESTSRDAHVDYCRCNVCQHVWSVSKSDPNDVRDVTVRPPKSDCH